MGRAPKGRGGAREGYAPPGQRLAPRDRNHQDGPPRPSGGGAKGPGGGQRGIPPHPSALPRLSPPPARGRPGADQRDGGPAAPLRGCCTQGGDAAAAVNAAAHQAPPVGRPLIPA